MAIHLNPGDLDLRNLLTGEVRRALGSTRFLRSPPWTEVGTRLSYARRAK